MFLGYSSTQKGYKCYSPQQRKVYICRDITFLEQVPFYPPIGQQGENNIQEADPLWMTPMPHMLHLDLPQPPPENSTIPTRQQPLQNQPRIDTDNLELNQNQPRIDTENLELNQTTTTTLTDPDSHITGPQTAIQQQQGHSSTVEDTGPVGNDSVQELNADLWLPIAFKKGTRACT